MDQNNQRSVLGSCSLLRTFYFLLTSAWIPVVSVQAMLENADFDLGLQDWVVQGRVESDGDGVILIEDTIPPLIYQTVSASGFTYELRFDIYLAGLAETSDTGQFDQVSVQVIAGYDVASLTPSLAAARWDLFEGTRYQGPDGLQLNAQIRPNLALGEGWYSAIAEFATELDAIAPVVAIRNRNGTADSAIRLTNFELRVVDRGRLTNISTRGRVGVGDEILIPGFVIIGSGSKPFLLRAAGPSLVQFGPSGWLVDPVLRLFQSRPGNFLGDMLIGQNDDWDRTEEPLALKETMDSVGAFRFFDGQKDAALEAGNLPQGAYTALIEGKDSQTGISLVEVYDLNSDLDGPIELVNLSCRSIIGNGPESLIPGFAIGGTRGRKVLIRAVGPGLAGFGVEDTVSNPCISLHRMLDAGSSEQIRANDMWNRAPNADAIRSASIRVGAFPLPEGSRDAAILQTLAPGRYSVTTYSGYGGSPGIGLVEFYLLDDNHRPMAFNRTVYVGEGPKALPKQDILASAFDPDGDDLDLASFTQPAIGSLALYSGPDRALVFYNQGEIVIGETISSYTVTDGEHESTPAILAIQMITNKTCVWKWGASGDFHNPENWQDDRVPGPEDAVWIAEQGRYTITVDRDLEVASLRVGATGAHASFVVRKGHTLTVSQGAPEVIAGSDLIIEDMTVGE